MHVKALLRLPIALGSFVVIGAAASGAIAAPALQAASPIQLGTSGKYGQILVNPQGMTLYELTSEAGGKFACSGGCLAVWPPLLVPAGTTVPTAAPGVVGTLGVVTRPDGTVQATQNGFPLYTFAHDSAPGDTNGQGIVAFGGTWHVIQNTFLPLSATAVERLAIHITTSGNTVWGRVTASYNQGHNIVRQTCARASCLLHIPYGVKVHLVQSPTNAANRPFTSWLVRSVPGTMHATAHRAATSLQMQASYAVHAVYAAK
jgi:predicted lipoprotein with Yx(FWY)xxD motif